MTGVCCSWSAIPVKEILEPPERIFSPSRKQDCESIMYCIPGRPGEMYRQSYKNLAPIPSVVHNNGQWMARSICVSDNAIVQAESPTEGYKVRNSNTWRGFNNTEIILLTREFFCCVCSTTLWFRCPYWRRVGFRTVDSCGCLAWLLVIWIVLIPK